MKPHGDVGNEIFGILFCIILFFLIVNCIEIIKHNIKHNKEMKNKLKKKT
jgi:hypothetical protein